MPFMQTSTDETYDVVIIGAGLSGLYALYTMRRDFPSWRIKVIDNAADVGGTWFWNRYPGCRFDSESISYAYSFDQEVLDQWHWKEAYSPQPETLKYVQFVADKHDLYKHIRFETQIKSAKWDDAGHTWTLTDETARRYTTQYIISCVGFLSAPTLPNIPGVEDFRGRAFHTSRWPKDFDASRDLANKRIGVIGTGATGIQTITAVSKEPSIRSLNVFQRTANWSAPLRNFIITEEQMAKYRAEYDAMFRRCAVTPGGFLHQPDPRKATEVTDEERVAHFEKLYAEPGFAKWLGVFSDTYTDRRANSMYSEFIAGKIRARVHDKQVAESLIPKNHGFGTRRVPMESGYFEAFNQPNVHLVDLQRTPIVRINEKGVETDDGKQHDLDVLIYATGFDAITGAFNGIDWLGKDDRPLIAGSDTDQGARAIWPDHRPNTYMGLMAPAMPNMFMVLGPHQPFGNGTRNIEHAVDVVSGILSHCKQNGYSYIEPTVEAAEQWHEHVYECSKGSLMNEVDSWMTGVNKNVKGKTVRSFARYPGSAPGYRRRCAAMKAKGYTDFIFAK